MKNRKLLRIPGPVEFSPAVLRAMGMPTTSHVAANFIHHRTGHTCWSGYAGQINNSIRCLDIPNMFGLLRKFLGEFYISSQPTRDWDRIAVRYEDYLQS